MSETVDVRALIATALKAAVEPLPETTAYPKPVKVYQASAIHGKTPHDKPFLTYRMSLGTVVASMMSEDTGPISQQLQVWAHDIPGDYGKVDEILGLSRETLEAIPHQHQFMQVRMIEVSADLYDDAMGTITRFSRFQLTTSR